AACAIAWTAINVSASLPYWPIDPSIATSAWFNFQLDLVRAFWALLQATILWGASFPLALASVPSMSADPAKLWAGIYAANTLGAIAGAFTASLLLIGWVGSQHAQQALVALSMLAALILFFPNEFRITAAGIVAVLLGGILIYSIPPIPGV